MREVLLGVKSRVETDGRQSPQRRYNKNDFKNSWPTKLVCALSIDAELLSECTVVARSCHARSVGRGRKEGSQTNKTQTKVLQSVWLVRHLHPHHPTFTRACLLGTRGTPDPRARPSSHKRTNDGGASPRSPRAFVPSKQALALVSECE